MTWKQTRTPNLNIQYEGGWCLKAVQDAFGTPHKYPSAMADWQSGENGKGNHDGELPPRGVYVPVYFSLGSTPAGHVAISLPDGRVASSTLPGVHQGLYIHPSLYDLTSMYAKANGSCSYLGWSEGVGDTRVVESIAEGDDMTLNQYVTDLYQTLTGSVPKDDIIKQKADFIQKTGNSQQVIKDIMASARVFTWEQANLWALSVFHEARGEPGEDKMTFAKNRFYGGDDFPAVMFRDMHGYLGYIAQLESSIQNVHTAPPIDPQTTADAKLGQAVRELLKGAS